MLATATDSQTHFSIGTPSPHKRAPDGLWAHGFRNCFTPSGVLFTFPSRYWFAIGQTGIFRLTQRSGLIHTGFHEARATWETRSEDHARPGTGPSPSTARAFKPVPLACRFMTPARPVGPGTRDPTTPRNATPDGYHAPKVWPSSAFARHYSRNILSCGY